MIESLQNEKIKHLTRLSTDNRYRKHAGLFIVEGKQENDRALQFGYKPEAFFICEELFGSAEILEAKINYVSKKVYERIAFRGTTEGILGVYRTQDRSIRDFKPGENAAVIIVEGVEKPGNLGAILRSAEAFSIDAVIITDGRTDIYNPNVIRSSVGCFFGAKIFTAENQEVFDFLKLNGFNIYSTYMSAEAISISQIDFLKKTAVIFGTEHTGISDFWRDRSKNALIPMAGTIDSLNLSNAVAITCYEILKQKML